ncbi:MAG TPA: SpoIIE family protein phosphatase, partial [Candidatus Acidoferrales bacterium]
DASYEEGQVAIGENSVLVAYTDGLTEPENVYGEEFGSERLMSEVIRNRHKGPRRLAESLIAATEEWAGTPEQADDITVVIAGMK